MMRMLCAIHAVNKSMTLMFIPMSMVLLNLLSCIFNFLANWRMKLSICWSPLYQRPSTFLLDVKPCSGVGIRYRYNNPFLCAYNATVSMPHLNHKYLHLHIFAFVVKRTRSNTPHTLTRITLADKRLTLWIIFWTTLPPIIHTQNDDVTSKYSIKGWQAHRWHIECTSISISISTHIVSEAFIGLIDNWMLDFHIWVTRNDWSNRHKRVSI